MDSATFKIHSRKKNPKLNNVAAKDNHWYNNKYDQSEGDDNDDEEMTYEEEEDEQDEDDEESDDQDEEEEDPAMPLRPPSLPKFGSSGSSSSTKGNKRKRIDPKTSSILTDSSGSRGGKSIITVKEILRPGQMTALITSCESDEELVDLSKFAQLLLKNIELERNLRRETLEIDEDGPKLKKGPKKRDSSGSTSSSASSITATSSSKSMTKAAAPAVITTTAAASRSKRKTAIGKVPSPAKKLAPRPAKKVLTDYPEYAVDSKFYVKLMTWYSKVSECPFPNPKDWFVEGIVKAIKAKGVHDIVFPAFGKDVLTMKPSYMKNHAHFDHISANRIVTSKLLEQYDPQ